MDYQKIQGLIAAAYTPMHEDGTINPEPIREYCQFLNHNKLSGTFINGTTGEGIMMTTDERKRIAEEWVNLAPDGFKNIVHIGGPSIETCKDLAVHAREIGAFAIGIMGPNFFKPQAVDDLVKFISEIASLVPDYPVYYYHMPSMSGVSLSMTEFLQQASGNIPNLVGLKFTHFDLMEFNQCMMVDNGKYDILHGYDETLLCGLTLGAVGGVGSTYNLLPSVYLRLMEYFGKGNLEKARQMQRLSIDLIAILNKYGGAVACGKAIMNMMGMNFGPCRLPIRNLSSSEIDELKNDLNKIDFFSEANYLLK
jgi:N-acetylneuraminate lyase